MISWAHGLLRAVNSLQLLPDKCDVMNYVIGCNEYLISTLSESTFPWVYPHIIHGYTKENVSGCFFLNSVELCTKTQHDEVVGEVRWAKILVHTGR